MITEKQTDIEVKYLMVKSFKWHHPQIVEAMAAHPIPGRVYRSIFNINSKHYKILLPEGYAIPPVELTTSNDLCDCKLDEILLTNILDFDIKEEDLDQLINWLYNTEEKANTMQQGLIRLQQEIHNLDEQELEAADRASDIMMTLWKVNPDKFNILLDMAEFITHKDLKGFEETGNYLRSHPIHGLGINIKEALTAIDRYAGDDRKTNQNLQDLYEAVNALVVEAERKLTNEID